VPTDLRNIDYVKALHLKQVGLALASLWVIVLIAAASATIYREIDGPNIRSTISENRDLITINSTLNSTLNENLDSARKAKEVALGKISSAEKIIDQLNVYLVDSQSDHSNLKKRLESYLSLAPLIQVVPDSHASVALPFSLIFPDLRSPLLPWVKH